MSPKGTSPRIPGAIDHTVTFIQATTDYHPKCPDSSSKRNLPAYLQTISNLHPLIFTQSVRRRRRNRAEVTFFCFVSLSSCIQTASLAIFPPVEVARFDLQFDTVNSIVNHCFSPPWIARSIRSREVSNGGILIAFLFVFDFGYDGDPFDEGFVGTWLPVSGRAP